MGSQQQDIFFPRQLQFLKQFTGGILKNVFVFECTQIIHVSNYHNFAINNGIFLVFTPKKFWTCLVDAESPSIILKHFGFYYL